MNVAPSRLFGREEEFALLLQHFESVKKGHGTVILIGGEAGIGKTSLAESLASRAQHEGALVVQGYCLAGVPIPYFPFTEALNKFSGSPTQATLTEGSDNTLVGLPTGNRDLDQLLGGGIPENYAVALTAPSCDEKGLLIEGFLECGAKKGEVTFYVTINLSVAKSLAKESQSNFYLFLCNPQADALVENTPNTFKLRGVDNLTDISIALTSAMRRQDPKGKAPRRICIDLVSDVLLQHRAVQTRKWLTALIAELKSKGFTILAVLDAEMHPQEELHAILGLFDGEISIYEKEGGRGSAKCLRIKKMIDRTYSDNEVLLKNVENELLLKREDFFSWPQYRETGQKQSVLNKDEMFELILEKLKEVSRKRPLLLFLEDLQWADSASLVLLHYLARNTRENMVLIVGTYRSEELSESDQGKPHPLLETMRMMSREGLFHRIELGVLQAEFIKELASTIIRGASDQILQLVVQESEGNPLYAVESADFLIGSGAIKKEDNQWKLKDPHGQLEMPPTIRDLIARRLGRLDRMEMQVVECASVVGEHFTPDVIARALNLDELRVTQKLAGMGKEKKLVFEEEKGYRFEHAKVRDAVYDGLGRSLAKALHHKVAEALLEINGPGTAQQVAYHYHTAGVKDRTIKFGLMAGDNARQLNAFSEATTCYGWVIEAAGEELENCESRAEALVGRAESLQLQGLNEQAVSDSEEALRISKVGSTRVRALRWLGESLFSMGHLTEAIQCVARANDEPGEEPVERLSLRRIEALFVGYKGDQQVSLEILRVVGRGYLQLGMREEYADCLLQMGSMYLSIGDVQSAVEVTKEAEAIYGEPETGGMSYHVYQRLASIYFATGDYVESSKNYGKAVELCSKFGLFDAVIWNETYWGQLNDAAGKYEEALEHLLKALKAAELSEAPYAETGTYSVLVRIYLKLNRLEDGERAFIKMNELYDKHSKDASLGLQGLVARTRAFRLATQGLWKEAGQNYSKSIELLHRGPLGVVHETETRLEYVEWLLKQNRIDEAKDQLKAVAEVYQKVGNNLGAERVQKIMKRIDEP
jgi:predicted ATPase